MPVIHSSVDGDPSVAKISLSACITASFAFLGIFAKNKHSPVEIRSKFQVHIYIISLYNLRT